MASMASHCCDEVRAKKLAGNCQRRITCMVSFFSFVRVELPLAPLLLLVETIVVYYHWWYNCIILFVVGKDSVSGNFDFDEPL